MYIYIYVYHRVLGYSPLGLPLKLRILKPSQCKIMPKSGHNFE